MKKNGPNAKHDHGPIRVPKEPHILFGLQIQGPECGPRIGTKLWSLIMGSFFGPSIRTISMWSQNRDQKLVPE